MATRALALSSSGAAGAESSSLASRKTTKTYTYKNDGSGNISTEVHTHVDTSSDAHSATMRRMEERIRVIHEDLESEQQLRRRIEREKQALQAQIIALSERLTEAEGGAESQLDINRKREAEMAKLRKLLEDVHLESEQNIHILKKKHQEAMMELQEQIGNISKSKEKINKEKTKMQTEISELLAHIEVLNQEKSSMKRVCEKLEININEYNVKLESMNKAVIDLTSQKSRLEHNNQEDVRRLNEMKHAIETAGLDKNKVASQLKELQSNLDNLNRGKATAENKVRSLEQHIKTITIETDQQKEVRLDLERQLAKVKGDCVDWKKKYDNEARLRIEEVEALRKKLMQVQAELQDQVDAALCKLRTAEQQKNKLQQEVQVIIKEVENSRVIIKDLQSKVTASEGRCDQLAAKLREMTNLYERADKENKARAQELVRMANDMDRCRMENEGLHRDKGKLEDDNRSLKQELDALKRRVHEMDQENRKLAHDREELARAYKDADNLKSKAESRVADLENELKNLMKDADRALQQKEDEFMSIKKKLTVEIESLTMRLRETEAQLRNEVEKIKKKMSVTIAELEMSLDATNKNNLQLQNTCKQQATKIMELTAAYDKAQQAVNDYAGQLDAYGKKLQVSDAELLNYRRRSDQVVNDNKVLESRLAEATSKITEIVNINNTLSTIKTKLEKELTDVTSSYEDIARELKCADDRANKAGHDAQHFESLLREEQSKVNRIDNAKRALEAEVKNLTIRMEEIETTAISSSKRTIVKMEQRIEELESILSKEKAMHAETATTLHKKDRSVKELLLQSEEDRKNILILQESLDRLNEKIKMYKRQMEEQEAISNSNIMRVKKFQRELEAAEGRAEEAESSLNSFRSQQRVFAAAAESRRNETVSNDVDSNVVIRKTVTNISSSNVDDSAISSRSHHQTSTRDYRAGSTAGYSRAGSVGRASIARGMSMGRSGSMLRY